MGALENIESKIDEVVATINPEEEGTQANLDKAKVALLLAEARAWLKTTSQPHGGSAAGS